MLGVQIPPPLPIANIYAGFVAASGFWRNPVASRLRHPPEPVSKEMGLHRIPWGMSCSKSLPPYLVTIYPMGPQHLGCELAPDSTGV